MNTPPSNQPGGQPEPPKGETEVGVVTRPLAENVEPEKFLIPTQDLVRKPPFTEAAAKSIADRIVLIFGIAVLGSLGFGFLVIVIVGWRRSPAEAAALVKDAAAPLITAIGTFASTVFGPLLAFILGYYFGEKRSSANPKNTTAP